MVITEALFTEITVLQVVCLTSIVIAFEVGHFLYNELDDDADVMMIDDDLIGFLRLTVDATPIAPRQRPLCGVESTG